MIASGSCPPGQRPRPTQTAFRVNPGPDALVYGNVRKLGTAPLALEADRQAMRSKRRKGVEATRGVLMDEQRIRFDACLARVRELRWPRGPQPG